MTEILRTHAVSDVMHFAAFNYVGEFVSVPLDYYEKNTGATTKLLEAMNAAAVKRIVFSSTCASYGERRPGDPPELFANADFIRKESDWQPKIANLVASAWG